MLETFIQEFSSEMELKDPLPLEDDGSYSFLLEEDVKVHISAPPQGFLFTSIFAPLPQENKEKFITKALLGNLFGQGTRGAVLGLNEAGTMLTLSQMIDTPTIYKEFSESLEDFINTIDFWRGEAIKKEM